MKKPRFFRFAVFAFLAGLVIAFAAGAAYGQSTSGTVTGSVFDPSGAGLAGATVTLTNPVSGYSRTAVTDGTGTYRFYNLPFDQYSVTATSSNFVASTRQAQVYSPVPLALVFHLQVSSVTSTVEVQGAPGLVEQDPNFHTDVDRSVINRLPIESPSSELSSIVTLASPGVAADSNGLMHGLGDHAENSFNVDGEPITDQQSKVFSNQVPAAAVQSLEVIDGAPPAEYGDKTSLIVKITTRSGQGVTTPTGTVRLSYSTFGTSNLGFDTSYGGTNWGNFIAVDGLQSGRFLDGPEFAVLHDKGNEENFFDRFDYNFTPRDSIHFNAQYTRSWFQTPNDFENIGVVDPNGNVIGNTDQRSKIGTINFSPTFTHVISDDSVANIGVYVRRDAYNYYPSNNPFADYALDQQQETISQYRTLTNMGVHADISYVHGINNAKLGGVYEQTLLRENDSVGVVDPTLTPSCLDTNGNPTGCTSPGATPNPNVIPVLVPYDLTQAGSLYAWKGRTDVKQLALYGEDQITAGNWLLNFGIRGDFYNGMTIQRQAEPRVGISYNVKPTNTVLRVSYARTQETPFNENLVLSSTGCSDPVLFAVFSTLSAGSCATQAITPFNPGFRNEFHAGFGQSVGRHFVFNGEYIWKYTHNAYDFSVLGTTPITFPIEWASSKIPGYALSATLTDLKGLSVRFNASSVAARFFNPQLGGVGATPGIVGSTLPFRIDHDEHFNETTHLEYAMPFHKSMYVGFNWRYDTGLVAGASPCYNTTDPNSVCNPLNGGPSITINGQPGIDLSYLSPDQQFQAGLVCNGVKATPTSGLTQCLASQLTSNLIVIPAPGTEDDDKNPQRIQPRTVFDLALGDDNIMHFGENDRYKFSGRITAINLADKYALYNFLSTFSGTHYLTPRTVTGEVAFHF
ncbi:TonB-dependent receptor [Granulicella sp. 5B5]|uniref:TonB-dependent receptor n=1 Tax=Granulicella sp. 5B5 TaxID=1617967 RepID=UPI0015F75719|nr:TonB-dependent receptor [Granulicella sp. 5B5]QMV19599.1 TonB-dependent receptor [Granulicella sp. 5B5]